jgi:hypothetical protein
MKRPLRIRLLLLALGGVSALAFVVVGLPVLTARGLEKALGGLFKRPVSVGSVSVIGLVPLQIEIRKVRVGGATPESPPFLELERAVLVPLGPPLGRTIVLARLRLESPRIRIHAPPGGGDDIPKMGGGQGGGQGAIQLRIRRLVVTDGEFLLDHRRVPMALDLPDFGGRLAGRPGGGFEGHLAFGPGSLRFGEYETFGVGTEFDMRIEKRVLTVANGHVRAPQTDLVYEGELRFRRRIEGEFDLSGPVDLALLDRHVFGTGFNLKGDARWDGRLTVDGSRLRLKGTMQGTRGEFDGQTVPRFKGQLSYDEYGVRLYELDLDAFSGSGVLNLDLPPGPSIARLDGIVRGVDAEATWRWIFDLGVTGLGATADGSFEMHWPKGRFKDRLSGRVDAEFTPRADGRTPLQGRLRWRAADGVQFIDHADLRAPTTSAVLAGRVEVDERTNLSIEGDSTDIADTDDLLLRFRRALGTTDAQRAGFSGTGRFVGRWTGTLKEPVFSGQFSGDSIGYLGVVWGHADWSGTTTVNDVRSAPLILRRGTGEMRVEGWTQIGYYGQLDGLDVRGQARGWPAEDLIRALGWDLDVQGPLSGEVRITGRRSAPRGEGRVDVSGRYYGIPFSELRAVSRFQGTQTTVKDASVHVGGGQIRFSGSLTDDGFYDGAATVDGVDVGAVLPALAPDVSWGGRLSGEIRLLGPLDRPRVTAQLASPRIFLGDEGVGALEGQLWGAGDGLVTVAVACRSPRVELRLAGTVNADPRQPSQLRVTAHETSLDPFLRALAPKLPAAVRLVSSGELTLQGPLASPKDVRVDVGLETLRVLFPEYVLTNPGPIRFDIAGGVLRMRDALLTGDGSDLTLTGSADLLGAGPLALEARGAADLRALSALTGRLRGRGSVRLTMDVAGTRREPRVAGAVDLEGASLRLRGFPQGVEAARGRVRFSESAAEIETLSGTVGGGSLEISGRASYGKSPPSADVQMVGRRLALRYPEGLRSVVDADLRLFGDEARQWLSGSVDVRQAHYTRRYDLATELLAAAPARATAAGLGEGVRLDIRVRAPGTIQIDNNLTTLWARAEMTLQGTAEAPVATGRAEIDRGRIYFQGNTYTIRRGVIDFVNPRRTDPLFDIEAETTVRAYRVTLKVSGTLDRVYPTLTSDPPLSAVQILTLLAGGDQSAVASLTRSQADQAKLAAAGAATLAAGRLSEEVGLERQAERLFGLNRFSIDPSLVRGEVTNPTARLSVGKRLTSDLNVLYSVDLRGTEERILVVEYTFSDRLSVLAIFEDPGGAGFDLKIRRAR